MDRLYGPTLKPIIIHSLDIEQTDFHVELRFREASGEQKRADIEWSSGDNDNSGVRRKYRTGSISLPSLASRIDGVCPTLFECQQNRRDGMLQFKAVLRNWTVVRGHTHNAPTMIGAGNRYRRGNWMRRV